MRRRAFITGVGSAAIAGRNSVVAQPAATRALIAVLVSESLQSWSANVDAFQQRLRQLGYLEGQIDIVYRYADGDQGRMPALAMELVRLNPDIIVTTNTAGALAAKRATITIPIVSAILTDPVGQGLAVSDARPGGNVTGIRFTLDGLVGKQLELAREMSPGITNVGLLVNPTNPSNPPQRHDAENGARALGLGLLPVDVDMPDKLDAAFQKLARERVDLVVVLADAMFYSQRVLIATLALPLHLPTVFPIREHVEAGGLISYGVDLAANHRRAADYVDKILKGANVGDLPLEFPTKLKLAINLKTAKALGLAVPPTLLARADEVIE
jgi:putative ABC transport system substrate-binding protein